MQGRVKWFNEKRGFGFITIEGKEEDVFVHYTGVLGDGFKTLKEGDDVEFTISKGNKGDQATEVKVVV
jgi:CspA family cold shock protein